MNNQTHFNKVTGVQVFWVMVALSLAALIEASTDWLKSQTEPSLTVESIMKDAVGLLLVGFIIAVPLTMLFWNKLVAPVFDVRKIKYVHGLVIGKRFFDC